MVDSVIPGVIAGVVGGLEIAAVALIAVAFAHAFVRAALHFGQKRVDAYDRLRGYLGKALLLGLELLVAADIIRTVLLDADMGGVLTLGLLVVVRIVLGWSIAVEIEGCWPWQMAPRGGTGEGTQAEGMRC